MLKALNRQMKEKSIMTRQSCELITVLPGALPGLPDAG